MRYVPNILSICRLVLSPLIIVINQNHIVRVSLLLLCGITDIFDGYIARKYSCTTKFGAKLDSLADFIFYVSVVISLIITDGQYIINYKLLITLITVVKLGSVIVGLFKNNSVQSIHTISNKVTGICIFISVVLLWTFKIATVIPIVLIMALLSAIEEFLITMIYRCPDINKKSLFTKD